MFSTKIPRVSLQCEAGMRRNLRIGFLMIEMVFQMFRKQGPL